VSAALKPICTKLDL